jgi:hypothetical protein
VSQRGWPLSQAEIDQYGAALFAKWGGLEKARDCFPGAPWPQNAPAIRVATPT